MLVKQALKSTHDSNLSIMNGMLEAHHQCWRLIHGELTQLTSPEWKFMCISATPGEKCLQTIWNELLLEIEGLQYLDITKDAIWTTARIREMERTLTREESKRVQETQSIQGNSIVRQILVDETGCHSGSTVNWE